MILHGFRYNLKNNMFKNILMRIPKGICRPWTVCEIKTVIYCSIRQTFYIWQLFSLTSSFCICLSSKYERTVQKEPQREMNVVKGPSHKIVIRAKSIVGPLLRLSL